MSGGENQSRGQYWHSRTTGQHLIWQSGDTSSSTRGRIELQQGLELAGTEPPRFIGVGVACSSPARTGAAGACRPRERQRSATRVWNTRRSMIRHADRQATSASGTGWAPMFQAW